MHICSVCISPKAVARRFHLCRKKKVFVSSETVIFGFLSLPGVFIFEVFLPHEVCENESALRKMANCVVFLDTLITKMTAQISVEKCNKFHGNAWETHA